MSRLRSFGCRKRKSSKGYSGFTLIECLVALVALTLIISSFSWLLQIEKKLAVANQGDSARQWHLFVVSIEGRSREWQLVKVEPQQLYFRESADGDLLWLEFSAGKLRKRKGRSSELMLENVKEVVFAVGDLGVRMDVTFKDGKNYQGNFSQWQTATVRRGDLTLSIGLAFDF